MRGVGQDSPVRVRQSVTGLNDRIRGEITNLNEGRIKFTGRIRMQPFGRHMDRKY